MASFSFENVSLILLIRLSGKNGTIFVLLNIIPISNSSSETHIQLISTILIISIFYNICNLNLVGGSYVVGFGFVYFSDAFFFSFLHIYCMQDSKVYIVSKVFLRGGALFFVHSPVCHAQFLFKFEAALCIAFACTILEGLWCPPLSSQLAFLTKAKICHFLGTDCRIVKEF